MKHKSIHTYLSREQSLALYSFMRHPALTTEGLSFVAFVAVSDPLLMRLFLQDLRTEVLLDVQTVTDLKSLIRIYREGRSDTVYAVLCRRLPVREAGNAVDLPISLYRDFIFERRLKHIYIGDADFIASVQASLPDLFLINQAVLSLENLRAGVECDLAFCRRMHRSISPEPDESERLSLIDCLDQRPFDLSDRKKKIEKLSRLLYGDSLYTDVFVSINLAAFYLATDESEQAVGWLNRAERWAEELRSRYFRRAVELHRAFLCLLERKWGESEIFLQRFIAEREIDDPAVPFFSACVAFAYALMKQGRMAEAEGYFRYAVEESRQAGAPLIEGFAWLHVGELKEYRGDYRLARLYYRKALTIYTSCRNRLPYAFCLLRLGRSYFYTGDKQQAGDYFKGAAKVYRSVGLHEGMAMAGYGLAVCGKNGGRDESRWEKAVALLVKERAFYRLFRLECSRGFSCWYEGKEEEAAEVWRKVRIWAETWGFTAENEQADLDALEGLTALSEGNYTCASECLAKAAGYFEGCGDRRKCLYLYEAIGCLYARQEEYDASFSFFRKGLEIAVETGNLPTQYRLRLRLAEVYGERGEVEEACKQRAQADSLWQVLE